MGTGTATRILLVVAGVSGAVACAAPSRTLSLRVVEDPITLPRQMAAASAGAGIAAYRPTGGTLFSLMPGLQYGLTDRLEWSDLLSFRYAFLDDAPRSPNAHAPVSLAVQAGARGVGFSGAENLIVFPLLSIQTLKHVADRWEMGLSVGWFAGWVQSPPPTATPYGDRLFPTDDRWSEIELTLGATRQLTQRIALGAAVSVGQFDACISFSCGWSSREGNLGLRFLVRPRPWVTLGLFPYTGSRYRPLVLAAPPPPTGPVETPPRSVHWLGLNGILSFNW